MSINEADVVLDALATRLHEEKFCNVNFKIGHETILANRVMLAIRSPVFEKKLYDGGEWVKPGQTIKLDAERTLPSAFTAFLEFVYAGELEMNEENVIYLLWLAREFGFPSLASACVTWCMRNVTVANALELYLLALKFEETEVAAKCLHVIRRDPMQALAVSAFTSVSAEVLASFTADPLLDINEIDLFRLVLRWRDVNNNAPADKLKPVMDSIRYGAISPKDLVNAVKQSGLAPIELYVEALEFHADPRRVDASLPRFQPRQGPGKVPDYSGALNTSIPASALNNVGPHEDDGGDHDDDDNDSGDDGPAAGYPGDGSHVSSKAASKLPKSSSTKKNGGGGKKEKKAAAAAAAGQSSKKDKSADKKHGKDSSVPGGKKTSSIKASSTSSSTAASKKQASSAPPPEKKTDPSKSSSSSKPTKASADVGGTSANPAAAPLSPKGEGSEKKKKSWFGL